MTRKHIIVVAFAILTVNVVAALLMGAGQTEAPQAVYLPDYEATLQLVAVADDTASVDAPAVKAPAAGAPAADSSTTDASADPARSLTAADNAGPDQANPATAEPGTTDGSVAAAALELEAGTAQCWRIGPIAQAERLEAAQQRLVAQGFGLIETRESTITTRHDHLVYLGPFESRSKAKAVRRQLLKEGLEAHVILSGTRVDAVSVGVFRKRQYAEQQARRTRKLGYEPRLTPMPRFGKVSHIVAQVNGDAPLPALEVEASRTPCPDSALEIASAK